MVPAAPASAASASATGLAAAASAPVLAPYPAVPRTRLDPLQDAERSSLWERVRQGLRVPTLDNERVRKWEQYYLKRPDYLQRMLSRGGRYLFHIVEEVERRGMPTDLALLPFIESAFNPEAKSRAAAAGMWQFMPGTGREFELRQNVFRDDRRDVLASTRAALEFLQQLNTRFGDWHLALAAYNWGPGNVQRAVDRERRAGRAGEYTQLARMPAETRDYVPKFQAIKNLFSRPQDFGIELPPLENHPYFLSVRIERDIDVAVAVRLAGIDEEDFRSLNPQHNKPVILAAGEAEVLLPYDNANRFVRGLGTHQGSLATWTAWVAPRTMRTGEAARLIGLSETALREVNQIPPRMVVKGGSTLLVPRRHAETADVSEHLAMGAALSLSPEARPLRRVVVKASRRGESLTSLAKRHKLAAAQVAGWNDLPVKAMLKPGQSIVLMLPPHSGARSGASKRKSASPTRARSTRPAATRSRR